MESTKPNERIPSLDFLRGVAVLGILFINAENFAFPDSWSPWKYGFENPLDQHTRFWVYFLTQGKFYNMFALLFGVGFYIFLERLEKQGLGLKAMDIYARRLLWLFVIGIAHAYLVWTGDVLYHYAICGFLLFPFRSMGTKSLLLVVAFLASLELINTYEVITKRNASYEIYLQASQLPENEQTEAHRKKLDYWTNRLAQKKADTSFVAAPKPTYWEGLKKTYQQAMVHKGMVYHKGLLFTSLVMMILGIFLYRSGVFRNYQLWKYYWPIALTIFFSGLVINYFRFYHWTYRYNEPILSYWKAWFFEFHKQLLGLGYILMLNGVYQKFLIAVRTRFITYVGRMALTNYIFQNIVLGILFYGYGFELFNRFSRIELLGVISGIWFIQLFFSWWYLKRYKQGPLEWLWRKLTYPIV